MLPPQSSHRSLLCIRRQTSFLWLCDKLPQTKQLKSNTHPCSISQLCRLMSSTAWLGFCPGYHKPNIKVLAGLSSCVEALGEKPLPSSYFSLVGFSSLLLQDWSPYSFLAFSWGPLSGPRATCLPCHMGPPFSGWQQHLKTFSYLESFWYLLLQQGRENSLLLKSSCGSLRPTQIIFLSYSQVCYINKT